LIDIPRLGPNAIAGEIDLTERRLCQFNLSRNGPRPMKKGLYIPSILLSQEHLSQG